MVDSARRELARRLGKNLASWRKALDLTQDQVALRLKVEPETVSRFERGATLPSLPTLAQLAEIYGATMGELLEEEPPREFRDAEKISAWLEPLSKTDRGFTLDAMGRLCIHLAGRAKQKPKRQ